MWPGNGLSHNPCPRATSAARRSPSDLAAVVLGDHDAATSAGARRSAPSGQELYRLGLAGSLVPRRRLARVLDADEHRPLVRRHEHAGDLADVRARPGSGASRASSDRRTASGCCRSPRRRPAVDGAARDVGLDPQPAARRDVDAVGRAVLVADDRRAVRRHRRIAARARRCPSRTSARSSRCGSTSG